MIIKEKEFTDLKEELGKAREENYSLNEKIHKLEKELKPDIIRVEYCEYLENPYKVNSWSTDFIKGNFHIESNINLSIGIRRQVLNIFRQVKQQFGKKYVELYKKLEKDSKKKNDEEIKKIKGEIIFELYRIIHESSLFSLKLRLIDKLEKLDR